MEKVIFALWRDSSHSREAFNRQLLGPLAQALLPHVHALRINVQDEQAEGGTAPRWVSTYPQMEAWVQVWIDSALAQFREPIDRLIGNAAPRYSAWLVCESVPIRNTKQLGELGHRNPGYSHIAVISVPPRLSWRAWQDRWQKHHTEVAIGTQSTTEYIQGLVVRPLTYGAAPYAAFIEESFPAEAKVDSAVFHAATGDPEKLATNKADLMASVSSFVDEDRFDLIPVSCFDFKRVPA